MTLAFLGLSLTASLGSLVLILALAFGAIMVINPKSGRRVANAVRAQVGEVGRFAQSADPMTNYRQAIDDEADNVNKALSSLADADVLVRSVTRQVNNNREDVARYTARIKNALAANDEAKARDYATRLAQAEADLATNEAQLELHKATFAKTQEQIKVRRNALDRLRNEAKSLNLQLELSKQELKATQNNGIGAFDEDGLQSKRDAVVATIDKNRAQAQVAGVGNDSARYDAEDTQAEADAAADAVLERFRTQSV